MYQNLFHRTNISALVLAVLSAIWGLLVALDGPFLFFVQALKCPDVTVMDGVWGPMESTAAAPTPAATTGTKCTVKFDGESMRNVGDRFKV
ncbi:hypothetical protein N7471_010153 [Penicillium samsonianum]|uniref:uncharacterized protein n=1 Tax=Penicillium samsonianum TaxID=1882272 RepID=UPI002546FDEB|nr:uncharacterized protein N7471_010153 [Penicillium samsonianum]KAJ6128936.1 hypothetical protein N7471_010153 [Penicillium samsonianum]